MDSHVPENSNMQPIVPADILPDRSQSPMSSKVQGSIANKFITRSKLRVSQQHEIMDPAALIDHDMENDQIEDAAEESQPGGVASGAVPTLIDALKHVRDKAEYAVNLLQHDKLFPEEKEILDRFIPNGRVSEMSVRDALRAYIDLQKVAIKRMHQ